MLIDWTLNHQGYNLVYGNRHGQMDTEFIGKDTDAAYYQDNDTGKVHVIKNDDFVECKFTVHPVEEHNED